MGSPRNGENRNLEVLILTEKMKALISGEASESVLRQNALSEGTKSLAQAGMEKVLQGTTSMGELLRVICTDLDLDSRRSRLAESGRQDQPALQEVHSAAS